MTEHSANPSHNKTVIIVLGPTGVGKTGVSVLLAKALKTEIISADSMQVYQHMDIGTAKPSPDELREVPHHLIGVLSPARSFSAGMFKEMAVQIINDLHIKNKIPLIVGGTGLYIRSLTGGLFEGPSADWSLREKLKEEAETLGREHLHRRLGDIDPEAAAKINPNDSRRTIRALEVALKEGRTISGLQCASTKPEQYDFIKIGLFRERKELYGLIEERVDRMIKDGLLQETENLLKMGPDRTAMQALGYKEMGRYIQGEIKLEEAVRLIKKRTKMYAKRQLTWFKKEPGIKWVDITGMTASDKILDRMLTDVHSVGDLIINKGPSCNPDF
ncbi:MAG: tRNA (adenosine(37)-N6)-dimethylallyltransferase MiaA [Nitrospiraceae bacterium]|nr:MAG: tRNA (adenosine(37)-N6)-dimethylallyltransferase MiaA [Nitrospiraceae bacterium]